MQRLHPAALLVAIALATPTRSHAAAEARALPSAAAPPARVVVLGLDAASWNVVRPLIDRGELPNLARLVEQGAAGDLASFWPLRTPQVWTSTVTGKLPGQHRIWDHLSSTRYNPPPYRTEAKRRLTTRDRRSKALWQLLSKRGLRTFSVGWIATWPAEQVPGATIVAPFVSINPRRQTTIKGSFFRDATGQVQPRRHWPVARRLMVEPGDVSDLALAPYADLPPARHPIRKLSKMESNLKALRWSVARAESVERLTLGLYDAARPDVMLLYFQCGDSLAHRFWIFQQGREAIARRLEHHGIDASHAEELHARFGRVVETCWRDQDARIGRILTRTAGPDTLVLVLSDHGFGDAPDPHPDPEEPYGGNHLDAGLIVARGPHVKPGAWVEGIAAIDLTPTILHYLGAPIGADMRGRPALQLFEQAWVEAHPVKTRPSYEKRPQLKVPFAEGYPSRKDRPLASSR
jgi:hypothetical protein